ncbi:MAG: metal ABC transporter substrate-binding protein, partial [Candidatus Tectomicrobia bacterium]|nr:metal ABC transporter substrate-binding protein [Candidatus Tectomicrobia bacterium]
MTSCLRWTTCAVLCVLGAMMPAAWAAEPLRVVTTVRPITDMARQVGGNAIQLHGMVPEGMNSHTFRPTPRDVRYLAEADVIILNGLYLEIPTEKLVRRSSKAGVRILKLGDQTLHKSGWIYDFSFPKNQEHPNPHLWLNVKHAMRYVILMRDALSRLDRSNQGIYHDNTERYLRQLSQLDACIATAIDTIPPTHRKLLTYHDSWPYFARRYGMRVIGAVQPASFSEPSARDVARMIDQIRQSAVPAIFGSEVFPSKVLEKIAAETNVQYVKTLRDDDLPGTPGEPEHSYLGMMRANVHTMVRVLGGNPAAFEACSA